MNPKYKPEIIVGLALIIFFFSLFLENEKVQLTMQITSNAIAGYFGFISNKDEVE